MSLALASLIVRKHAATVLEGGSGGGSEDRSWMPRCILANIIKSQLLSKDGTELVQRATLPSLFRAAGLTVSDILVGLRLVHRCQNVAALLALDCAIVREMRLFGVMRAVIECQPFEEGVVAKLKTVQGLSFM